MIGEKLRPRRTHTYFFLVLYGIMAVSGGVITAQSFLRNESLSGASGFMVIFGTGMFLMTLVRSIRPQVSVFEDFLELHQSRTKELVRYRNIANVSRPDPRRMVITLREDGAKKDVTIWLKELEKSDVDRLADFLSKRKGRG